MVKIISKISTVINNPKVIIKKAMRLHISKILPDKMALKILYYAYLEKKLDIKNPKTFNEKLQWLKLYDRNPLYTNLVDKYEVRKYISETIGEEYLIPLIGVWDKFEDINFARLPNQFVLKCNHDSGGVVICTNKDRLDIEETQKKINNSFKKNFYYLGREWPYKNVNPKIICEKYMVDESGLELKDYKFMCFNGEPKIIQVMSERKNGSYFLDHFDLNWNKVEIPRKSRKGSNETLRRPDDLEKMINISRKLSRNIPFSRIDLYATVKGVYFGEITFFPVSGYMDFEEEYTDYLLGSWITIPSYKTKYN